MRLDEDSQSIADAARAHARARIAPLAADVDRRQEFSPQMWAELRELGVFGLSFAPEVGGVGASTMAYIAALEQIAESSAVAALYSGTTVQVANALLLHGSDAVKSAWVPTLVAGDAPAAWAFTEPQTGSDPRQLQTRAERRNDGWVLNGQKAFISYAGQSPVALVFAKTSDDTVGAFLVETDQPGWTVGGHPEVMAFGGTCASTVFLDDVFVPDDHLLGGPEAGFDVMLAGEAVGKIRVSAICVGVAQRALDEAAAYALERMHRGRSIGEKFPSIQTHLADMQASILAARSLLYSTASLVDAGQDPAVDAAALRIVAGRAAREVASSAMQVCGAYGMTREMPVERLYREAKFYEVAQGAVEIQRVIVAKDVLRRQASGRQS